jgi:predicted DsbA family dithiol-disulfide isomerase
MRIDFFFDVVCPWCFIGKRRLERALILRPNIKAEILWRPFLLNPDLPPEGMDHKTYLERKLGGEHRVRRALGAVVAAGQSENLTFDFDAVRSTPNSLSAHRLIFHAARHDKQGQVLDAVYRAYFQEGKDIGEISTLINIGVKAGIEAREIARLFQEETDLPTLRQMFGYAHRQGIGGVPSFVFDGAFAIAGAHEPEVLLRLIDLARECESVEALVS